MDAGWIIRAPAILLAIAIVATITGAPGEGGWLQGALASLATAIGAVFQPLDAHLLDPVRTWLGKKGLAVPAAPYAGQASLLLFLLLIALDGVSQPRSPTIRALRAAWAVLVALLSGALVGALEPSDPRLPWAVMAAIAFWGAGLQAAAPGTGLPALPVMLAGTLLAAMAAGIVPVHFSLAPAGEGAGLSGTGWMLAWLSLVLVGLATLGGRDMPQGLRAWASDPAAQAGLSILAVIAAAAAISAGT